MVDSTDLFPKGSISLSGTKTFGEQRIDRAILDASALMSAVGGTLREVFENVIQERKGKLPPVENASYEDKAGIIGWVSGKRILLGNREMLHKYKVNPPELDFEQQYVSGSKQVIYLAVERQLMAMFILTYEPDRKMALEIQRLEENGIAMIVRTWTPTSRRNSWQNGSTWTQERFTSFLSVWANTATTPSTRLWTKPMLPWPPGAKPIP